MAQTIVRAHWVDGDLAVLAAGVGPDGRRLPSNGWMALRRLGWHASGPVGVVVSDRVRRIAQEQAARVLRVAAERARIVAALIATWPADPCGRSGAQWAALRALLPGGVDAATVRNRTRQITAFTTRHGRLPAGLCELENPPLVARQVCLAAADRQQVIVERVDEGTVRVHTQLPLSGAPASYGEWAWHTLQVRLPPTVPAGAPVCTPTLRPGQGKVRVDLPWQTPVATAKLVGHTRAVGVDWGLNTLLSATLADLHTHTNPHPATNTGTRVGLDTNLDRGTDLDRGTCAAGGVSVDGRVLRFDASGVAAKLVRLRRNREHVKTKLDHLVRLREGHPSAAAVDAGLVAKLDRLQGEHAAICARIRHLNHALAWSAARWLVDQATTASATVIYVEDLATLEGRGRDRSLNRRLSGQVRGQVFTAITHLATKAGITVVTVPARGTSSGCPRCGATLRHVKAPDRSAAGYRWATCTCGLSLDRDHAAAQRITARGLTNQHHTRPRKDHDRGHVGHATIRQASDTPVHQHRPHRRAPHQGPLHPRASTPKTGPRTSAPRPVPERRKTGPTPKQVRPTTLKTSPLPPSRQQAPAPAMPNTTAGKRPAGRTPQKAHPGRQVPHTSPTNPRHPHQVRAAIHGQGFHRHVHATPVTHQCDNVPAKRPQS